MRRILIIDDHPLFREALQSAITRIMPKTEIHEASNFPEALKAIRAVGRIHLVLLDLYMPNVRGFEGLLTLRTLYPTLPVAVISGQEDARFVRESLNYGAAGFIPKSYSKEQIASALSEILEGNVFTPYDSDHIVMSPEEEEKAELARQLVSLTRQQLVVLKMVREGKLNKQIAHEIGLSQTTIKSHVSEILRKLNVISRTQAVLKLTKIDFDSIAERLDEKDESG
ncbi:MAG: response regulator transcription factor [Dichotomicrobium sp.]